jgi:hypothetical protein
MEVVIIKNVNLFAEFSFFFDVLRPHGPDFLSTPFTTTPRAGIRAGNAKFRPAKDQGIGIYFR